MPESEADIWIGWGTHVFRDGGSGLGGAALEDYLNRKFDEATAQPGSDFFSALTQATFRGRPLTRAETLGFANLTFAGGRDTIIQTVANAIAYLGRNPEALGFLRGSGAHHARERGILPLLHAAHPYRAGLPGGSRFIARPFPTRPRSLCWASANLDRRIFENPDEVRLDRKPNPHVAFGFGTHLCLGAPHARLILRTLLEALVGRVRTITVLDEKAHWENEESHSRPNGYDVLSVKFAGP